MAELRTREDRSLGELFSELSRQTGTLIRQEMQLAKAEMSEKASEVGKNLAFLAVGGFVAYAGFLALLAALVIGLSLIIPAWLAALIVGLITAGVGYFLIQRGISQLKQVNPVPERTVETLREDKEWLQDQIT